MDKVLLQPQLHPTVKAKALQLQKIIADKYDLTILYTHGHRSNEQQANLYAQGRTRPGKIVTNAVAGHSYHNYGLALDFVPLINKKVAWSRLDLFELVGKEAERLGFKWGGNFKSIKDRPHIELTFGLSIADLLSGKRPPKGDDPMTLEEAVKILQQHGIMNSPDYWLQNARKGKTCEGEYVGLLIQRLAEKLK